MDRFHLACMKQTSGTLGRRSAVVANAKMERGTGLPHSRVISRRFAIALLSVIAVAGMADGDEQAAAPMANPFPNAVEVPDGILDGGTEWLNTSGPINLKDLKGKIVVLDFWTYCCINCMHVLPDLKFLEEKYPNQLVVIGVHSAKFDNEKDSQAIRDAILRYEIQHPVVNDSEMAIWRRFGTQAWPTLALIDPEGKYAGSQSGEGHRELFDNVIGKLIEYHRAKGTLDETPTMFRGEASKVQPTPLRYPGKVTADAAGQRLFITDSNHNRIVVTSLGGELQSIIGRGSVGRADGASDVAEFNRPQGTVLHGNTMYVADTENHSIRGVDVNTGVVSTLAGTGQQGNLSSSDHGPLLETPLNSPWSVAIAGQTMYIAMAGSHQIWSHKLGSDVIGVFAGTGREDVINGLLLASAFAQPSEIVADASGAFLYVVDSEGSAIRRVPTDPSGVVTTIAGTSELANGQSLFAFGDVDGVGANARFQHPLGIAIKGDQLFVADSYNHKIRSVELSTATVASWTGTGSSGVELSPLQLSEPGGLSVAGETLFVADTNNHRVLSINLASQAAIVLPVVGLNPPVVESKNRQINADGAVVLEQQKIALGEKVIVRVRLNIPADHKLNDLAPVTWDASAVGEQTVIATAAFAGRSEVTSVTEGVATFEIPLQNQAGSTTLLLAVQYAYCSTASESVCRLATAKWSIPLEVADGGQSEISIAFPELLTRRP